MESLNEKKVFGKEWWKGFLIDFLWVLAGCVCNAYAVVDILLPYGLASGGLNGVAVLINLAVPIDIAVILYGLTGIIVLLAWIFLGFGEVRKVLMVSIISPATIFIFEQVELPLLDEDDILLASIFCGIFYGLATACVFHRGYSFGSTDTLAKVMRKKLWPHISQTRIMTAMNAAIIITCAFTMGKNIALYALITQFISTETIELILHGLRKKMVQIVIITDKHQMICDHIINKMNRGVSINHVRGGYTGEDRTELRFLCTTREEVEFRRFLKEMDPDAFVTVTYVEDVWGNGFNSLEPDMQDE